MFFQFPDGLAYRGLGYIKPFGSEAHLSGFRDCDENFQMTDSHSFPPYIIGNSYIFNKIISFYLLIGKCYNTKQEHHESGGNTVFEPAGRRNTEG